MDKIQYKGQQVPIITKSGAPGDIVFQAVDQHVTPTEHEFVQKNIGLENAISAAGSKEIPNSSPDSLRRSTLVEIQTPTSRIIYKTKAIFPFDLFPNELIIDEIKVSFVYNGFLHSNLNSILIKDITNILVSNNLFFGAVQANGGNYQGTGSDNNLGRGPLLIGFLNKKEAYTARRLILGLMIFSDQKVDTSQMSIAEIISKTGELGRTKET